MNRPIKILIRKYKPVWKILDVGPCSHRDITGCPLSSALLGILVLVFAALQHTFTFLYVR